jgi:hypothetical protein
MTNAASSSGSPKMVTGLFRDSESVERAYQSVAQRGYDKGDINVVMSDDTRKRYFSDDRQSTLNRAAKQQRVAHLAAPPGETLTSSSRSSPPALSWRYPAWV